MKEEVGIKGQRQDGVNVSVLMGGADNSVFVTRVNSQWSRQVSLSLFNTGGQRLSCAFRRKKTQQATACTVAQNQTRWTHIWYGRYLGKTYKTTFSIMFYNPAVVRSRVPLKGRWIRLSTTSKIYQISWTKVPFCQLVSVSVERRFSFREQCSTGDFLISKGMCCLRVSQLSRYVDPYQWHFQWLFWKFHLVLPH